MLTKACWAWTTGELHQGVGKALILLGLQCPSPLFARQFTDSLIGLLEEASPLEAQMAEMNEPSGVATDEGHPSHADRH